MKHKHYEMIVAKAENTELIQFYKANGSWHETNEQFNRSNGWAFYENTEYFLCLPQHKEACLHWLNGGEVECSSRLTNGWESCGYIKNITWSKLIGLMSKDASYRIKPKKEKRWIGVAKDKTTDATFKTKEGCMKYVKEEYVTSFVDSCQFIEIEVEV